MTFASEVGQCSLRARATGPAVLVFISAARRLDRRRFYDEAGNVIETELLIEQFQA